MEAKNLKITPVIGLCELCIYCRDCKDIQKGFNPSAKCNGPFYRD